MELMKAWLVSMVLMFGLQAAGVSDEPMLQSLLGSVEEKRQWYRERAAGKEYYELNNNPSLSVDEVAPLYSKSRAEVKLPVAMGTLQVVQRAQESLPVAEWAKGTSLTWLPPDRCFEVLADFQKLQHTLTAEHIFLPPE
ncbi:hypothetical protein AK812_SmicGene36168, partial [Symbiodinium microadriaticum]